VTHRVTASALHQLSIPLERLYENFNSATGVADPVRVVRRYTEPIDQEVVAFCAAALAFGRVGSVLSSVEALLTVLGSHPAAFVKNFNLVRDAKLLRPLVHRWIRGIDLTALIWIVKTMLLEAGSIERYFLNGQDVSGVDVGPALNDFASRALAVDLDPVYGHAARRRKVEYFFPRPEHGSACKRLNLFLRWMVRRDSVDLGIWSGLPASKLVIPLDAHVIRVGRCLGLTRYRTPGWRMAVEITESLRRLDPHDPVRYDFSLCHLGMMDACGFNREHLDDRCPLRGVCRPSDCRPRGSV